ncbi:hypothetical protein [Pleurocapsa sp. FMAR1]|uniref:hypothetical protein n=1 Tax=Pleurocapsa sp. FMAR1 TaxID=3040204 RepID=UPI0029C7A75C|nr:hypothetical protein [Pleurocapsa sp. FMAR1]
MELLLAASAGALAGKVVAETVGGIGVAVVGTAFGIKTTEIVLTGVVLGIAAYGISQAVSDW